MKRIIIALFILISFPALAETPEQIQRAQQQQIEADQRAIEMQNIESASPYDGGKLKTKTVNESDTNKTPGQVPGSKAVYQKAVDSSGNTMNTVKTTFDPKGNVVHIKNK